MRLTLVFDRYTTAELVRVLAYDQFALTKSERDSVLLRVMLHAQAHLPAKAVSPSGNVPQYRDPQDQCFIDLACSYRMVCVRSYHKYSAFGTLLSH